jgi:hypothetical protein
MRYLLRPRNAGVALAIMAVWLAVANVRPVYPLPTYAARTGLECRSCHFDPNGGGPRSGFGYLFEKQRHDLTPDPDTLWAQIPATNRIGDVLSLGTNTRLLYLYTRPQGQNSADLSTFFQMEGALDFTLELHPNLTVVMVRDFGEFTGDITRDLYGLFHDANGTFYLKAGRIRQPFGLRQDDHTSGIRAGFLSTSSGGTGGFLPYDPRQTDSGIEVGVSRAGCTLSAALTNGGAAFANKAQTGSAKLVAPIPLGHVGLSVYDSYQTSSRQRFTRWAAYGLAHAPGLPDLTLGGEFGFGTDDPGDGTRRNLAASFAQVEYRINRTILVRTKYDFSDVFRSAPGNASERYVVESDLTLVPFADLKLSYRQVVPETTVNEQQLLAMLHFYY